MRFEADRDLQADVISNSKFVGSQQFFVEIDGYLKSWVCLVGVFFFCLNGFYHGK